MNILIGINHPKQVHMFKNLYYSLNSKENKCYILVVDKEISCALLDELSIPYLKIGMNHKIKFLKLLSLFPILLKTLNFSIKNKIDLFIGQALVHFGISSFLLRKKFIIFEDTENAILPQFLSNRFADTIITPQCFSKEFGSKQIKVNSTFELAYLRYNWFKPNEQVLKKNNLSKNDVFIIVRFVQWTANHDIGYTGISIQNKIKLLNEFSKFGKVLLSSESELPKELKKYQVNIDVSDMHSLIYYSSLVYGESASMAAESAYLGIPAIYLNNNEVGYTNELAKYNLVYMFSESIEDQLKSIEMGKKILKSNNKNYWKDISSKLVDEYIDFGSFMNWFMIIYK